MSPYIKIISATICDTALVSLGCDSSLALAKWSAYLENDSEVAEQETTKALVRFAIDNTNALTLGERSSLPEFFGPFPVAMALGDFHTTSNIPGTTAIWLFMFKMTLTALATDGNNAQMVALAGSVHGAMLRLEALRGQMTQAADDAGEMEALARDIIKITEENERKYHAVTVSDGGACLVDTPEWTRVVQTAFKLCTGSTRAIAEAHDVSSLVGNIASCLDETGGEEGNPYKTVTAVAVLVRGVSLYASIHADALKNNAYLRGQWETIRGTLVS